MSMLLSLLPVTKQKMMTYRWTVDIVSLCLHCAVGVIEMGKKTKETK